MMEKRFIPKHDPDSTEAKADCEEQRLSYRDVPRGGAKLPYVPPVIETFYPSIDGLPPGVFEEWGAKCFVPRKRGRTLRDEWTT